MYPVRALSLYNGWNLLMEKPDAWSAIQESLLDMLPYILGQKKTGRQFATLGDSKLALKELDKLWKSVFRHHSDWVNDKWLDLYFEFRNELYNTLSHDDSLKDKVLTYLTATNSKQSDLAQLIFITNPKNIRTGLVDLSVLLVPENGFFKLFGSRDKLVYDFPFDESQCRNKIESLSPIPYGGPLVILFFSQYEPKIPVQVEEVPILSENIGNIIERSLEFAPEYTQAGISVLSYFSEVLRQKYPDLNVKVRIEQQGTTVLMHVELPSGNVDTIREELATYFLVVAGKEKPEALLSNPLHVMALENKLQIANMELRMSHQLNAHLTNEIGSLKTSQQRMEETFKAQIAEQGTQIRTLINLAAQQSTSHERVQLAQIGHIGTVFQGLISEAHGNQVVLMAIRSLEHNLMSGIALIDVQDQLSASLNAIKQQKPSLFAHLASQVESAGFGAAGSFVLEWISTHA